MSALQSIHDHRGAELKMGSFGTASADQLMPLLRSNLPPVVPLWRRCVVAALCVLLACLIRYLLAPIVGEELPFMLFIAAAMVAAWYGGAVCGLAALALGLFLADSLFLHRNAVPQPVQIVRFIRYVFTACLGVGLIEVLQ